MSHVTVQAWSPRLDAHQRPQIADVERRVDQAPRHHHRFVVVAVELFDDDVAVREMLDAQRAHAFTDHVGMVEPRDEAREAGEIADHAPRVARRHVEIG